MRVWPERKMERAMELQRKEARQKTGPREEAAARRCRDRRKCKELYLGALSGRTKPFAAPFWRARVVLGWLRAQTLIGCGGAPGTCRGGLGEPSAASRLQLASWRPH